MSTLATLRDVARQAGVNPSTVSRVVNGDRRLSVRAETRRRILAAVSDLDYEPNAVARGLRLRAARAIGLTLEEPSDPEAAGVLGGVLSAATEAGYCLVLAQGPAEGQRLVRERRVDGLLVLGPAVDAGCPRVTVGRRSAGYFVAPDDTAGARMAVERLIAGGHRRIACVADLEDVSQFARFEGYREALASAGLPFEMRLLVDEPPESPLAGLTAVFVAGERGRPAAGSAGGAAPMRCGSAKPPACETVVWGREVRVPLRELGMEAVRLLCDLLRGRFPSRPGRLVTPQLS